MVIARLIKEKLSSTPAGVVLTTRDFGVEMRYQPALTKVLNRLVLQGELQKTSENYISTLQHQKASWNPYLYMKIPTGFTISIPH